MNTTDEPTHNVTLSVEELAILKENYVVFCNRIAEAKNHIAKMNVALEQGDSEPVLELWKPLKIELSQLNTMALQLNKGDYGLLAREQLESLLSACEAMQETVLNTDPASDADSRQKAQDAYTPNKPS